MAHEPQTLAARFLGGELGRARRWRFQRHLVECEDCWVQVRTAQAGRTALESLREVAPARTRERVRAVSGLSPDRKDTGDTVGRRRWVSTPITAAAIATVVAAVIGFFFYGAGDPGEPGDRPLAQVVAAYHDAGAWAPAADTPPAASLDGLSWTRTRTVTVDGTRIVGHYYAGRGGATVLVLTSDGSFPVPPGAGPVPDGDWIADVDGLTVFCTRNPVSLVVGDDTDTVTAAARALSHRG